MMNSPKILLDSLRKARNCHEMLLVFGNRTSNFFSTLIKHRRNSENSRKTLGVFACNILLNEIMSFNLEKLERLNKMDCFMGERQYCSSHYVLKSKEFFTGLKDLVTLVTNDPDVGLFFNNPAVYSGNDSLQTKTIQTLLKSKVLTIEDRLKIYKYYQDNIQYPTHENGQWRNFYPDSSWSGRIMDFDNYLDVCTSEIENESNNDLREIIMNEPSALEELVYQNELIEEIQFELLDGTYNLIKHKQTSQVIGLVETIDSNCLIATFNTDAYLRMAQRKGITEDELRKSNGIYADVIMFRESLMLSYHTDHPSETNELSNTDWSEWLQKHIDYFWDNIVDFVGQQTQFVRIISRALPYMSLYPYFDSVDHIDGTFIAFCRSDRGYSSQFMDISDYFNDMFRILSFSKCLEETSDMLYEVNNHE